MKTSLFSSILCASLMVFAVGCGKDNSSGGGGSKSNYKNLYNSGLSTNQKQVLDKVKKWYDNKTEGQTAAGFRRLVKTKYDYNTTPNCEEKKFLGIPFQYCTYNGSSTNDEVLFDQMVNMVQTDQRINQKGNAELNKIFSGGAGTLVNAIDVSSTRSELTFLGNDGVVVKYLVDRAYHSLANPISKIETSQASRTDTIVNIY